MTRRMALQMTSTLLPGMAAAADELSLDAALDAIAPGLKKWASICLIRPDPAGLQWQWHSYRDTAERLDFWPASCVKLYAAVAALELAKEQGWALDTTLTFAHQEQDGSWHTDCARTLQEMLSEVFRRSSNEDYTLLLRVVGIDRINTQLLVPERGFPHSAIMRGYVAERPCRYERQEPQRITAIGTQGQRQVLEHVWSGRSYAEERGCTVIDAKTGNVTSPRELADCLRRVLYHHQLPEQERYRMSDEAVTALVKPAAPWVGLETKAAESGPAAWRQGLERLCPTARFAHKCGMISNYALETFFVEVPDTGVCFIAVPVVNAGHATQPHGEAVVAEMSSAIYEWARRRQ